jgi:hypothetical protein
MEHDEKTDNLEVETQNEDTETVEETDAEEVEVDEPQSGEPTEAPKIKLTYEEKLAAATTVEEKFAIANAEAAKNRRLLNKKAPAATNPATKAPPASSSVDVDERILLSQGMTPELVRELRKVAKVLSTGSKQVGLIEAQSDSIFVAIKEKYEREQKAKKASVGASRGSGNVAPKKDAKTPGLTREEHKKMVESMS